MSETFRFNLLDDPWIPLVYRDGTCQRVGILQAMKDAHLAWRVDTGNPLDTFAITRLLLAVLYWCRGNPPDDLLTTLDAPFPGNWFDKARDNARFFELLADDAPRFFQDPTARNEKPTAATNLIHEIPSGNNYPHFYHVVDEKYWLSPAACAIGLVRLPVFTTMYGKSGGPGINGTPPVYLLPEASSLAGTLRLSWAVLRDRQPGIPAWEEPIQSLPEKNVPLLTGLTWLPRRVWLSAEFIDESTRCVFTGDILRIGVKQIVFRDLQNVDKAKGGWKDPHVLKDENALKSLDLFNLSKYPDALSRQWQDNLLKIHDAISHIAPWRDHRKWLLVDFNTDTAKFKDARAIRIDLGAPGTIPDDVNPEASTPTLKILLTKWNQDRKKHLYHFQCAIVQAQARDEEARKKRAGQVKKSGLAKFALVQAGYPSEVGRIADWRELLEQQPAALYRVPERSMAPVFFPGVSVRDVISQRDLQSRPFLDMKEYTREASAGVKKFVSRLVDRKNGIISLLRSSAGTGIDRDAIAFDLFTGLWWPIRQHHKDTPRRHVAWLVCKLYGWTPLPQQNGNRLPRQLARAAVQQARANAKRGNEIRESIMDRFDLLLNTPVERIEPELEWALATVADALDNPGIDWNKLIDHLSVWHRHSVRLFWAQEFANTLPGEARDANPEEEETLPVEETGS